MSCAAAPDGARLALARPEEKERRERDICDADRKALGGGGLSDIGALERRAKMRCEAGRNDANLLVAELQSKALRVKGRAATPSARRRRHGRRPRAAARRLARPEMRRCA